MNTKLLIMVSVAILSTHYAFAEDAKPSTPLDTLQESTKEMMKGLDENQIKQFGAISNSYSIIRTVEDVQLSIARAVVSCTKENPDLKDPMGNRFETWKEALRPVMKKARTKLDKMILLQDFAQPSQVRAYLKKFNDAVIYRNQISKPVPITKREDCDGLQANMNKTQNELLNLLTETLALNADVKVKQE